MGPSAEPTDAMTRSDSMFRLWAMLAALVVPRTRTSGDREMRSGLESTFSANTY